VLRCLLRLPPDFPKMFRLKSVVGENSVAETRQ
jgi:hypothetical protein